MESKIKKINTLSIMIGFAIFHSILCQASTNHEIKVTVNCPKITGNDNKAVKNYGQYLYGIGSEEREHGIQKNRLFRGDILLGLNIPSALSTNGYSNDGVKYNATNGAIVCKYKSTKEFDAFVLSYVMANAKHGSVVAESNSMIQVTLNK